MQLIQHHIYSVRKRGNMKWLYERFERNKEVISYSVLLMFLIIIVVCNNIFWKLGKETENTNNNIEHLKSNNVMYDVPYNEMVLD